MQPNNLNTFLCHLSSIHQRWMIILWSTLALIMAMNDARWICSTSSASHGAVMLAAMPFSFSSGCLADVFGPYPFSKTLGWYWLREPLLLGGAPYILVVLICLQIGHLTFLKTCEQMPFVQLYRFSGIQMDGPFLSGQMQKYSLIRWMHEIQARHHTKDFQVLILLPLCSHTVCHFSNMFLYSSKYWHKTSFCGICE